MVWYGMVNVDLYSAIIMWHMYAYRVTVTRLCRLIFAAIL